MSGFTFLWPWAAFAALVLTAGVLTVAVLATRQNNRRNGSGPFVWDLSSLLEQTGSDRLHSYHRTAVAALTVVCLATGGALALVGRPANTVSTEVASHSRDIVLCLDVSGSALPFDRQVIAAYRNLVANFRTERIGMSIFNSTSRTVFPLTDDYQLVKNQLGHALAVLSKVTDQKSIDKMSRKDYQAVSDWLEGTQNRHDATSLIGDGLVGCETLLPGFTATASRKQARIAPASIVFATDNVLSGTPIYTLSEALRLARLNSITVDGLYTGTIADVGDAQAQALRTRIVQAGGTFRTQADADSVSALVTSIEQQHVRQARKESNVQAEDWPWPLTILVALLFGIGIILLANVRR